MIGLAVFEQLADLDRNDDELRVLNGTHRLLDAVKSNLTSLFNTRKGSVKADLNYGVDDLSMVVANEQASTGEDIAKSLLTALHHYEPRLLMPKIEVLLNGPENLATQVVIHAELQTQGQPEALTLFGQILSDGSFELTDKR